MDEWQADEFLDTMRELNPNLIDLEEAFSFAISSVHKFNDNRLCWFGAVGNGTFYIDGDIILWYPEMTPYEAFLTMGVEFGEAFTDGLTYL